jgi:L,D-transpeptidase catalytic domain
MKVFTNLLFKVALSSMVLTAPAMIPGNADSGGSLPDKETALPFSSSAVIRNFIDHLTVTAIRAYPKTVAAAATYIVKKVASPVAAPVKEAAAPVMLKVSAAHMVAVSGSKTVAGTMSGASSRAMELRRVINESAVIYTYMDLEKEGLSEKAFEYAWRGYHNLVKKGVIRKRSVLSICDFSQSSSSRRMYVLDLLHKKLLYRTYVAHGQNSGDEFAETFSNEPESFKSSLGFYVTKTTYFGRNGLSLRLNGVDDGYNDQALKRNIVLHGCTYVGDQYLQNFGEVGTSLGCPALPAAVSSRIIRTVKDGSCLFIYHPTQDYLDHSTVIND